LGSRSVRGQIEEFGKTTAGQIGVSGGDAKAFVIPVPPIDEQRRIVAHLDGLQAKMDVLKKLQSETAAELAALLPSVLDKAFKGEL
jgi:type I restriction enzyme S subunit